MAIADCEYRILVGFANPRTQWWIRSSEPAYRKRPAGEEFIRTDDAPLRRLIRDGLIRDDNEVLSVTQKGLDAMAQHRRRGR